ncbi:MAG: hypothetical protein EXR72_04600 [Myxococcales bacterium]|nr:hypothetical protein [Myxococcales bacterium]
MRARHVATRFLATALVLLAAGGCRTRPWELSDDPPPVDGGLGDRTISVDLTPPVLTATCRQDNPSNKIDLLFLIDNSRSMAGMQAELRARFPQFIKTFTDLGKVGTFVDLHIGVVTSDYGAGPVPARGCQASPGGQLGRLQAIGAEAPGSCRAPVGASFLIYDTSTGGGNLPPGQSLAETFGCMASVGTNGCGSEHVLEAVYAALHNKENQGFLRDDALLSVVFLTNEDDCSAPPDTDLFDGTKLAQYGANANYRCTRFGIVCGNPASPPPYAKSNGPLLGCVPAPNPGGAGPGKLYDLSRYIDFLTKPAAQGGVKKDPFDVVLLGITAPPTPVEVILATSFDMATARFNECAKIDPNTSPPCQPTLQRSCRRDDALGFYGDPAVRVNALIEAAPNHGFASICNPDYGPAMQSLARLLVAQLGECCLPDVLPGDPNDAECTVEDVTLFADGTQSVRKLAKCGPGVALPCWRIERRTECAVKSPQGFGVVVDRGGAPVPEHTTSRASCVPRR